MDASRTRINIPTLSGPANYYEWARGVKRAARSAYLTSVIFTDVALDDQLVIPMPSHIVDARKKNKPQPEDIDASEETYKLAKGYHENQFASWKKLRDSFVKANDLLLGTIEPTTNVGDAATPFQIWNAIEQKYKPTDSRTLRDAEDALERLRLGGKSMTAYLDQAATLRQNVIDITGKDYSDASLVDKVLRGLPRDYSAFVDFFQRRQNTPGVPLIQFNTLYSRLAAEEARVKQRRESSNKKSSRLDAI
jgi:hypothetical protein